tara:strand:+ start:2641 stop:3600 length:960 start_codon:yes stop_codon:yes gene_type:complete
MLHSLPHWSVRHNYFHHSNPRSKDRSRNFFEKVHVRPKINEAWKVIKDQDSSADEREAARSVIAALGSQTSANMQSGRTTQTFCDMHLIPDEFGSTLSIAECTQMAVKELREYQPMGSTPDELELDHCKRDKYCEELPLVIENSIMGLKEAMAKDNRIIGEIELLDTLPGNAVPHCTLPDYGRRGDLKTKWSKYAPRNKHGWTTNYLPTSLSSMSWDMNNVFQCAGFWALNGHQPPFLVYANASDYRIFTPENAPELRDDFLQDVVDKISSHHKTTENILRAAQDKEELLGLVSPNWHELYWNQPQSYLDEAKKFWGVH